MIKILVVEDEKAISDLIVFNFLFAVEIFIMTTRREHDRNQKGGYNCYKSEISSFCHNCNRLD